MIHLFSALLFIICSFGIQANPYKCDELLNVEPPCNISNAWYYPPGFDGSGVPPQFAGTQNCTWKFSVPKGTYALLTITSHTSSPQVSVVDSVGNIEWINSNVERYPYFLLDPEFTVNLMATSNGSLGLRVLWTKIGPFKPTLQQMIAGDTPFVISSGAFDNGTVISSASRVSLLSLPPPSAFLDLAPFMRNTVIFDGPSINDKLIGNLYQIYNSGNHFVSSGKSLTLFSLIPQLQINNYVLLQDYENVQQFSSYKGIYCVLDTVCPVSIDARNGPGAAVRYSGSPHYLKQIEMQSDTELTVYTGPINDNHKLIKYTSSQYPSNLPQMFTGLFTTYVFNKGLGVAHISYNTVESKWLNPFDGRKGFIASKNFATSTSDQSINQTLSAPTGENYKITLSVENSGLTGDATLQITVTKGGKGVEEIKYTTSQLPTSPISAIGNQLSVRYNTNGSPTTGVYVKYEFIKTNAATRYGSLIIMIIMAAIWNVR